MSFDKLLSIETATDICSVCFQDEMGEVHEKRTERKGSHSELLFLFVRELMEEQNFKMNDLGAVLVSTGPGSYTGLRIAASGVKGMLFGSDVKVFAGNTLAGFAQSIEKGTVHAVINARRKHLYHQKFEKDKTLNAISEPRIMELKEIESKLSPLDLMIGTGIDRLSKESMQGVITLDLINISGKGLISLFNSSVRNNFFAETIAEDLESNYLNSSQVNNTSV
ncbi:MAG TPA: tRNA (adenosine(37)-N6)-threonylcarbamoyltransferase complex dimerization subunit type 1 TsaB [Gracilimonas sp.]|uniref:tRNA (adenosine(37)-N6)-threonylcarbamoyltransferase complex dimerization subunit type 1 TsaB n=1 Tax=Gracilimonas sp. TaxID=1974203 RepID=UPI002DAE1929|nr:tRNA (adenosine(37)-N6)-threonylcarbamoyltransferase complex dimerization subunit type 1 TsaB [Gracilimonas sp.]